MTEPALNADYERLRTAVSAVLYGSIWDGFNGPTGVTKDEALEYAANLAQFVHDWLREQGRPMTEPVRDADYERAWELRRLHLGDDHDE